VTLSGSGGVPELFYEDLVPGRLFDLGVALVNGPEMLSFARRFDPQWYYIDEGLAAESAYGAPVASGFYTASLFMRACVDSLLSRAAAAMSPGIEELRWLAPVYAGDRLAIGVEVLDRAVSRARPGFGTVVLAGRMTRLGADDDQEDDVLRLRFRGWFGRDEVGQGHQSPSRTVKTCAWPYRRSTQGEAR
jgi:acyl dehydratase